MKLIFITLLTLSLILSSGLGAKLSSTDLSDVYAVKKAILNSKQRSHSLAIQITRQVSKKIQNDRTSIKELDMKFPKGFTSRQEDGRCTSSADCVAGEQCENVYFLPCSPSDGVGDCGCISDALANVPTCSVAAPCADFSLVCTELLSGLESGLCLTCGQYQAFDESDQFNPRPLGNNPCTGSGSGSGSGTGSGSGAGSGAGAGTNPGAGGAFGGGPGSVADGSSNVCIDASLLQHLPTERLVFEEHRRGAVLCDEQGSCATPGHMVTYQTEPMMMQTYCQLPSVSCSKRTMLVNSPKMSRGLRIPSHTKDLSFTPLSARYESLLEEKILTNLVHMGL